jgi:putative membrane protein
VTRLPEPGDGWIRLSPLKLLLDPVKTLGQFLVPMAIAFFGATQSGSGRWLWALPFMVVAPLLFGLLPWFVTHYRMTGTQFQLRTGLLNKKTSTAPLDRIRSVDLEASLLHRILGLQKVQIGTGVDNERIELDALTASEAARLRETLLRLSTADDEIAAPPGGQEPYETPGMPSPAPAPAARPTGQPTGQLLAQIDWSWLRFAPFSLSKLVVVAGAIGVFSQFADELPIWDADTARSAWEWLTQFALLVLVVVLFVGALVSWLLISVGGYVVQWWDFRLTRERGNLHLNSGLFTTKSVTVEEAKVRGVELTEPVLLRVVGGAELSTLTTGLEDGTTQVLPPCPVGVATRVATDVLTDTAPMTTSLARHGFRARRRCWFRAMDSALLLPFVAALVLWKWDLFPWTWWWIGTAALVALGALAAELSYRHLGHALTDRHLVAGSGTFARIRTALETDGIIGWNIDQTIFQRRVGLATLTATTAAGSERVVVTDLDLATAIALADAATPGMLSPFLHP